MEEQYIQQLVQNLIARFELIGSSEFKLIDELELIKHPVTYEEIPIEGIQKIEAAFLLKVNYKRSRDGAVLIPVSIVEDPKIHEEWYDEWIEENNDSESMYYWSRLEDFMADELCRKLGPEKAGRIVKSIDTSTSTILSKLANPIRDNFNYKGLVVGYVQSGKTANFTALIAKAVDSGYRFIIVLSGIHSILRRQTQIRLDKELTGMNDIGIDEPFISEPSDIKRWNRITTSRIRPRRTRNGILRISDLGEFDTVNVDPFDSICNRATPTIAVIKKNVSVLDRLLLYVSQSTEENRARLPLLIIDDEADQASIDTNANDLDSDPTSTNERIRLLLNLFPRKAYVGYTATPFANILIDMSSENESLNDDLYPRNFIVSLPEPEEYFGSSLIFEGNLSDRFVKIVHDDATTLISSGTMSENLSDAIDQFLLCCAVRNLRGDVQKPMSMLVHVSHRIHHMTFLNGIIDEYLTDIQGRYNSTSYRQSLKSQLGETWDTFSENSIEINKGLDVNNFIPEFENVWIEIENVLNIVRTVELNSASNDNLDYSSGEEIKAIAIGGNQLSRGLTLEGLMTSYYLRASRQYDTLLQMGRWFGYRSGYEDLTRVHTTPQIWGYFEHLALVEEELRNEIYRYEEIPMTPLQMAVAIRDHRNLRVTARNKMGAAKNRQSSFSDSLNQTIWLPLDRPDLLQANYNLGNDFISMINTEHGYDYDNSVGAFKSKVKISGEIVFNDFLSNYAFVSKESTGGPGLDSENLLSYVFRRIYDQPSELNEWDVAIIGNIRATHENQKCQYGGLSINKIQRSRKETERGFNIGVLTEPDHLQIGLNMDGERDVQNPLLLLYLIWKDSKARTWLDKPLPNQRIDLFRSIDSEKVDVLGLAIQFPRSNTEPHSYIGQ